uniref:CD63 molecule n=1 Tax=Acanthochromis polyacanthus TaxID=80966 RepID=A0A3Q1GT10_9TELE
MAVEGGMKCVKFLLFFFNFIFWLCGLALIVVGILVQVSLHKTFVIKDAATSGAPIVVISIGVVIFFIAFFGCCGAWQESYCMVTTFAVLLSLISIVEIAAAITGYVYRKKVMPDSCCKNVTADCGVGAMMDAAKVYTDGCRHIMEEFLQKNLLWVIIAALVIAFLQIMGIVFACCLMRGIRSGYEVM